MGKLTPPINLFQWIEDNRDQLKPPVGNKKIWEDSMFDVFIVGGPNERKDYHINQREEFFWMIEGDMTLKVIEDGDFRDVDIKEDEIFLLPAGVPHSPQREANTIGLVIEHQRPEGVEDGLQWYCDECGELVYEEYFYLEDIVDDLKAAIQNFWADDEKRTCDNCGHYLERA
ncbi:MAG: 3-hydroxyanthranilate 3,4-dioxygenase [Persicimonas sp.]